MSTRHGALVVALAVIGTAPLHGQQRQRMHQPEMAQQGSHQGGMMMARFQAFAPSALLEQRETLGLTADQVQLLTEAADEAKATYDEAMATHERHRQALHHVLMQDTPVVDSVLTLMAAAHAAMGLAHQAQMQAALRGMAVLTAEQRAATPAGSAMGSHSTGGDSATARPGGMSCCNR